MTKTQVICTIGPKSNKVPVLMQLLEAGMGVARLNFSHGTYEYHASVIQNVRTACEQTGLTCAIMLDTKGPEIRSGKLERGAPIHIEAGQDFAFHCNDYSMLGNERFVACSYRNMPKVVSVGGQILCSDALLSFTVKHIDTENGVVHCQADNSGDLGEIKNMNLPGKVKVDLPAVTEKDKQDIEFGIVQKIDLIAASFIRKAEDVVEIRNLPGVVEQGVRIISKIENQEGIDNFNEILTESDGIMVARGDLGSEIPIERIATAQKMMIQKCNRVGKPVITATQMLDSMIINPRPTRAEATDVANAVFDGTDCVMLSGETANGSYPVECVTVMSKICKEAETAIDYRDLYVKIRDKVVPPVQVPDSIASSSVKTQWDVGAHLIVCLTETGNTARLVSKYRPGVPIVACSSNDKVVRQLMVSRGVLPLLVDSMRGTDHVIEFAFAYASRLGLIHDGDLVVVMSGQIEMQTGSTNMMRVVVV
jgi:pyruvate kinase